MRTKTQFSKKSPQENGGKQNGQKLPKTILGKLS